MLFAQYPYQNFSDYNLDWVIRRLKEYLAKVDNLEEWKDETQAVIDAINQLVKDINSGNFPDEMKKAITDFIKNNFYDIVGEMIKMVFFGLTDSGYFIAYIPESWKDIQFSTSEYDDSTQLQPEFGHLILSY